MYLMNWIF